MPCIAYKEVNFREKSLALIRIINNVIAEYQRDGYELTLRQTYYQLVARGYIENSERSYKNIGNLINDGRLAGLIDWRAICDRTRRVRKASHWNSPDEIIYSAARQYRIDRWKEQPNYVEVWVEKDALIDIIAQSCDPYDVPHFSCRGYTSQSEMWNAAQRFIDKRAEDKECHIIHLGDHDPSGIDMTRDIEDRLEMFGADVRVHRIALIMDQVEAYDPPPNPAKLSDSRCGLYIRKYGRHSWELDALEPSVLSTLITDELESLLDGEAYDQACKEEREGKDGLWTIADRYDLVLGYLSS